MTPGTTYHFTELPAYKLRVIGEGFPFVPVVRTNPDGREHETKWHAGDLARNWTKEERK